MKKTGIIPLVFLLGFFLLINEQFGRCSRKRKHDRSQRSDLFRKTNGTWNRSKHRSRNRSSAGPDAGSTADSATDSGKSTGGDTSGTSGSSDTKGNLPQTNAVETSRWVTAAGVLLLLGSLSLLSKKALSGDTDV